MLFATVRPHVAQAAGPPDNSEISGLLERSHPHTARRTLPWESSGGRVYASFGKGRLYTTGRTLACESSMVRRTSSLGQGRLHTRGRTLACESSDGQAYVLFGQGRLYTKGRTLACESSDGQAYVLMLNRLGAASRTPRDRFIRTSLFRFCVSRNLLDLSERLGLAFLLVRCLRCSRFRVYVCAWRSDRSFPRVVPRLTKPRPCPQAARHRRHEQQSQHLAEQPHRHPRPDF